MDFTIIKYNCRKNIRNKLYNSLLLPLLQAATCLVGGIVSGFASQLNRWEASAAVNLLVILLTICLLSTAQQATEMWHYRISLNKKADEAVLLYCFFSQMKIKTVVLNLRIFLSGLLYTLLLSLPGISLVALSVFLYRNYGDTGYLQTVTLISASVSLIVGWTFSFCIKQRYFTAKYLLMMYPDLSVKEAVKVSTDIMNGNCLKTALFKLSFVPLCVLCVFILPCIYVLPYFRQSCVCLKRSIIESFYEERLSVQ